MRRFNERQLWNCYRITMSIKSFLKFVLTGLGILLLVPGASYGVGWLTPSIRKPFLITHKVSLKDVHTAQLAMRSIAELFGDLILMITVLIVFLLIVKAINAYCLYLIQSSLSKQCEQKIYKDEFGTHKVLYLQIDSPWHKFMIDNNDYAPFYLKSYRSDRFGYEPAIREKDIVKNTF